MVNKCIKNFILTYIPGGYLIRSLVRKISNNINKIIIHLSMYKIVYRFKNDIFYHLDINNDNHQCYLHFISVLLKINSDFFKNVSKNFKSQLGQDLFIIFELKSKKNGYFVEFGAGDGSHLSNTYFLEKHMGWQGIIAEPARINYNKLNKNRNCNIDTRCVYNKTGKILAFNETAEPYLSTLTLYTDSDFHKETRKNHTSYKVETISLLDLLKEYNAPKIIDYLSINTQGSEFEIIKSFDFNKYDIKIITIAHNYACYKKDIYNLLTELGYKQVYIECSKWTDWYIKI